MEQKLTLRRILTAIVVAVTMTMMAKDTFTALEQQQISIATKGLFDKSDAFTVDFDILKDRDYSFPLPVGKAKLMKDNQVEITTTKGDAVKSMFSGVVRMSKHHAQYGNVIVVRHDNGLETVYGHMTTPLVDENMRVFTGDVLGLGGSTGRSTGPHLHFEFRYLGNAFNPEQVIDYSTGQLKCDSVYTITKAGTFGYRKSAAGVSGSGSAPKYVTIRKGDNLSAIARRNNTTVKALCRLNGIKETTIIREGRKLRVR